MNTCAIYIEHFIFPPTERIMRALGVSVEQRYGAEPRLSTGHQSGIVDVSECIQYAFDKLDATASANPDVLFASSVAPLQVAIMADSEEAARQSMFMVTAKNGRGHEWLYLQFVGRLVAPRNVIEYISGCVLSGLLDRNPKRIEPPAEESVHASLFLDTVVKSVATTLKAASALKQLQ